MVTRAQPEDSAADGSGRAVWSRGSVNAKPALTLMNRPDVTLETSPLGSSTRAEGTLPCARWIWPLIMALAFCSGCKPSDSDLSKIARDREAKPIIEALAAYQKAKGDFPPEASASSDLAPFAPAGVKLNFPPIFVDDYTTWKYRHDGSPGEYEISTRVGHDDYLEYRFEKEAGAWIWSWDTGDVIRRPKISLPP